jgi:hypothetical protein
LLYLAPVPLQSHKIKFYLWGEREFDLRGCSVDEFSAWISGGKVFFRCEVDCVLVVGDGLFMLAGGHGCAAAVE